MCQDSLRVVEMHEDEQYAEGTDLPNRNVKSADIWQKTEGVREEERQNGQTAVQRRHEGKCK